VLVEVSAAIAGALLGEKEAVTGEAVTEEAVTVA